MAPTRINGTCCCGINLRTGLKIWTTLYILSNALSLFRELAGIVNLLGRKIHHEDEDQHDELNNPTKDNIYQWELSFGSVYMILFTIDLIASFLLRIFIDRDNIKGCRNWIIYEIGRIVLSTLIGLMEVVFYFVIYEIGYEGMIMLLQESPAMIIILLVGIAGILVEIYVIILVKRFAAEVEETLQGVQMQYHVLNDS